MKLAARLLVCVVTLVLLLGVFEFVSRRIFPVPGYHAHARSIRIDPEFGFRFGGSVALRNSDDLGTFEYRLNSHGSRGPELPEPGAPKSAQRILFLGDSFMNAWSVREERHMMSVVRDQLTSAGQPTESYCMSCDDYGTGQELLMLKRYGEQVDPDVIVLVTFPYNDVANNSLALAGKTAVSPGDYIRPYVRVADEGELDVTYAHPIRAFFRRISRGFAHLERNVIAAETAPRKEMSSPERLRAGLAPTEALEVFRGHEEGHPWEVAWRETEDLLVAAREESERLGARLIVVVIPFMVQVQVAGPHALLETWPRKVLQAELGHVLDLNLPERRLANHLNEEGIEAVLLLDPLREASREDWRLYVQDGHLSWRGHEVAAGLLAEKIASDERSLPEPPRTVSPVDLMDEDVTFLDFAIDDYQEHLANGWNVHLFESPPERVSHGMKKWAALSVTSSPADLLVEGIVPENAATPFHVSVHVDHHRLKRVEVTKAGPFSIRLPSPFAAADAPRRTLISLSLEPPQPGFVVERVGFASHEPSLPGFPTKAFFRRDQNGDGQLGRDECSKEQAKWFEEIDADESGGISKQELADWLRERAPVPGG